MEINNRFINLPPFLSVSWSHVACLHMEEELLVITLTSGSSVEIPNLPSELLQKIFSAHASYLRNSGTRHAAATSSTPLSKEASPLPSSLEFSGSDVAGIRLGFATSLDGIGSSLQHNPTMAQAPDIPTDILKKFAAISKILAPDEAASLPKAEPNCNCMHCQIVRAIQSELETGDKYEKKESKKIEEELVVDEEELQFQQWEIKQADDNLFIVINRLEPTEQYHVFLGEPIGCTCGNIGCEHVVAVLKS